MKVFREQRFMMRIEQFPLLVYLLKWIVLSAVSGACIGSASALLLVSLNWATDYRESHLWVLFLLPLAGLLIGLMYHYLAGTAARGNNYLIEEIRSPHDIIPFRMAPLVYIDVSAYINPGIAIVIACLKTAADNCRKNNILLGF